MGMYVTVEEFRTRTKFTESDVDDDDAGDALVLAQDIVERATRQWFEVRGPFVFDVDGSESDALHFAVPIIDITEIQLNNSGVALDATKYRVYTGRGRPADDRKNPRVKLISNFESGDIFTGPIIGDGRRFRSGQQNQKITGTFGYVDEDDEGKLTTPRLIKRAVIKLAAEKLGMPIGKKMGVMSLGAGATGGIAEEWTDGHKRKYVIPPISSVRPGLSGITSDREILDIFKLYKAPMGIAVPVGPPNF